MKGLLLKDFYQIVKNFKIYGLLVLLFSALSVWGHSGNLFIVFYPLMLVCAITFSLITLDENSKWVQYCDSLPCTRDQVVCGKYLIGILVFLPSMLLLLLSQCLRMYLAGCFSWGELEAFLAAGVSMGAVQEAITLPFLFKYGAGRARLVSLVFMGCFFGGLAILSTQDLFGSAFLPTPSGSLILGFIMAVSLVLYALSWLLSIRFYRKRELG